MKAICKQGSQAIMEPFTIVYGIGWESFGGSLMGTLVDIMTEPCETFISLGWSSM